MPSGVSAGSTQKPKFKQRETPGFTNEPIFA